MARFRYSLQNILDIKQKLETQAKQAFATATGELQTENEKLVMLQNRKAQYEQRAFDLLAGTLAIRDIEENKMALVYMDDAIFSQQVEVRKAKERVEEAREAMAEAMMERKTYETLREQAFNEFLQQESKEESKVVDELVSYSYGQKRQENENG